MPDTSLTAAGCSRKTGCAGTCAAPRSVKLTKANKPPETPKEVLNVLLTKQKELEKNNKELETQKEALAKEIEKMTAEKAQIEQVIQELAKEKEKAQKKSRELGLFRMEQRFSLLQDRQFTI